MGEMFGGHHSIGGGDYEGDAFDEKKHLHQDWLKLQKLIKDDLNDKDIK